MENLLNKHCAITPSITISYHAKLRLREQITEWAILRSKLNGLSVRPAD